MEAPDKIYISPENFDKGITHRFSIRDVEYIKSPVKHSADEKPKDMDPVIGVINGNHMAIFWSQYNEWDYYATYQEVKSDIDYWYYPPKL